MIAKKGKEPILDNKLSSRKTAVNFTILLCVVVVVTAVVYWPVLSSKAFLFDDDQYLIENRLVQNPSWESAKRFVTEVFRPSTVQGYYQPLSMISLMFDCAFGGTPTNLEPFHRTSLILHLVNTVLLGIFLYLLFGRIWPATMLSLLYGLHPTCIESIAWISERKTVLAAFFAFLCLISYVFFVRKKKHGYYAMSVAAFILSLLSKPTIVAMPILLLLLDWWPLRRISKKTVLEKIPFFAMAIISAIVTFISQSNTSSARLPEKGGIARIALILCHNTIFYLSDFLYPSKLSWYYPFPQPFNLSNNAVLFGVMGSIVLIAFLLLSLRWTRSAAGGWLFFFIAIFPTMGVISYYPVIAADRHLYFPIVGFLLVICYLAGRMWNGGLKLSATAWRLIFGIAVLLFGMSESFFTRVYLMQWQDSEKLYRYMLTVTPGQWVLFSNLANVVKDNGKIEEAIKYYLWAIDIEPRYGETYNNLGNAYREIGKVEQSVDYYRKALARKPNFSIARYNLGVALSELGNKNGAIDEYRTAISLKPDYFDALSNLGYELSVKGEYEQGIQYLHKALTIEPGNIIAHGRLGLALANSGKTAEAIKEFQFVLAAMPKDVEMHFNLGYVLEKSNRIKDAVEEYKIVLKLDPSNVRAQERLNALSKNK